MSTYEHKRHDGTIREGGSDLLMKLDSRPGVIIVIAKCIGNLISWNWNFIFICFGNLVCPRLWLAGETWWPLLSIVIHCCPLFGIVVHCCPLFGNLVCPHLWLAGEVWGLISRAYNISRQLRDPFPNQFTLHTFSLDSAKSNFSISYAKKNKKVTFQRFWPILIIL